MAHQGDRLKAGVAYPLVSRPGKYNIVTGLFDDDRDPVRSFTCKDRDTGRHYSVDIHIDGVKKYRLSRTKQYTIFGYTAGEQPARQVTILCSMTNNQGTLTFL